MGYYTYFDGKLTITPPLTRDQLAILLPITENSHEPYMGLPSYYCPWQVATDRLEWDGAEKAYQYIEWLTHLIERFFEPWGCSLTGEIFWDGEESDDKGRIEVTDNVVKVYNAVITYDQLWYVAYGSAKNRQETPI